ncbi:MAG TPA: DUF362 domain-containing protein [Cyclobacteriaceae bacterium]|nr:DUF362 domain-containing protein [Cyclobacteriaceae bacterium]
MKKFDRRSFIKTSFFAGTAATFISPLGTFTFSGKQENASSSVAITTGDNRADLAFRALHPFAKQIRQAIGNRRVILKPNMVAIDVPLCATHADTLEGILEFLKSIGKLNNVVIAESAGNGPAVEGYSNYGYLRLADKYPVKLVDLDTEGSGILYVFDEKDFRPHPVRISKLILSPDSYIVSVARMKTHNRAVATLSLKNIIFGAPVKDIGFRLRPDSKPGTKSDKPTVHGSGIWGINYNLYSLASRLHPHLSVIDGFEGMEGNGPRLGTPVDHRVCIAGTDWLAADRVGVELMGIDMAKVGWLTYCSDKDLGETDLNKIEIIGERISDHVKHYKLHENIEEQLIWMKPVG